MVIDFDLCRQQMLRMDSAWGREGLEEIGDISMTQKSNSKAPDQLGEEGRGREADHTQARDRRTW